MGFIVLSAITFLSAFLLFQIELILGKLLLPQYGGSYLVWGACVVFFQGVLLLGYILADHFIRRLGIGKYLKIHAIFLLIPLLFFPGRALTLMHQESLHLPLVIDVFLRLLVSIGPVFFVLSTISLVTQSWLGQSALKQRTNPYALYAVSNLGSFLALLSYPFWVEHQFGLADQILIWRVGFGLLLILSFIGLARIKVVSSIQQDQEVQTTIDIPWFVQLRWLLLSAGGVMMFLSVTNIMTYEIAPVPLLWIIPLSIYLLAFVLNFTNKPWQPKWLSQDVGAVIGLNVGIFFLVMKAYIPTVLIVFMVCFLLFDLCMFTQRQLIQTKPAHPSHLTRFYVLISWGGFLGGVLATWIIPLMSTMLIEFLVGLLLIGLSAKQIRITSILYVLAGAILVIGILIFWPVLFKSYSVFALLVLLVGLYFGFSLLAKRYWALIAFLIVLIAAAPWLESRWKNVNFIAKHRNYYGIYQIYDNKNIRLILHGTTLHGVEFNDPNVKPIPIGYYSPVSPVGGVMIRDYFQANHVGVVGLGAGTLTMYAKPTVPMDMYELDADVLTLAKKYFHYIDSAPGPVDYIIGDARVSLAKAADKLYDLLVIDAFGGDAIPVHLINRDVIKLYHQKITPQGGILFHITNRYIDLKSLLASIARDLGAWVAVKESPDGGLNMRSIWAIMTWDRSRMATLIAEDGWQVISSNEFKPLKTWSDDYSCVLPMLKMEEFVGSLTHFKWWSLI